MPRPKGGYYAKDGKKIPGVTTILGRFKDSGGLLFWAFEQGKAAQRGEITDLYDKRDAAGDAGTLAHHMVEAYIDMSEQPDTDGIPEEIVKQANQGFENFRRWQDDSRIEIIRQEMDLISEAHRFGGCPDAIGKDSRGALCLLDWKTSNGVYVDYLIQIAAYDILWTENHPDQAFTGGLHLLRFAKENADFAHHFWSELDDAKEQFLLLRRAYDIDKKLKKRV